VEARTDDDEFVALHARAARTPGVVLVFEGGKPTLRAFAVAAEPLRIGRDASCEIALDDSLTTRVHAEIARTELGVVVRDRGSRNGTFVDGEAITEVEGPSPRCIRVGGSVLVPVANITPYGLHVVIDEGGIVHGSETRRAHHEIEDAARRGKTCLILGESGTGKESAAKRYHAASELAKGPFRAVNCAAIAKDLAESELFGAVKGAHSTALANKPGYFDAANGGVLFLDEIGTLDLALQAKLLRVVETKEFTPVGATIPKRVELAICAATNVDLDIEAERGAFRMDLLQRIRQFEVVLSPIRERPDEIAYIIERAANDEDKATIVTASLVEGCLLRAFRGTNVRGLVSAVAAAVRSARRDGRDAVLGADLPKPKPSDAWQEETKEEESTLMSDRERRTRQLIDAYKQTGNVDEAARIVGVSRSTAYAILKKKRGS
jgi:transcriptional regulator with PAS, ATPase and Fis domain